MFMFVKNLVYFMNVKDKQDKKATGDSHFFLKSELSGEITICSTKFYADT